jgi:hypothetical protein
MNDTAVIALTPIETVAHVRKWRRADEFYQVSVIDQRADILARENAQMLQRKEQLDSGALSMA